MLKSKHVSYFKTFLSFMVDIL